MRYKATVVFGHKDLAKDLDHLPVSTVSFYDGDHSLSLSLISISMLLRLGYGFSCDRGSESQIHQFL